MSPCSRPARSAGEPGTVKKALCAHDACRAARSRAVPRRRRIVTSRCRQPEKRPGVITKIGCHA